MATSPTEIRAQRYALERRQRLGAEDKLKKMGLALPEVAKPAGAYVPAKRTGNLIYVAGEHPSSPILRNESYTG